MSRRSSASVLGGIGSPSGVRRPSRRSTAFFSFGLKPRMPSRTNAAFIRLTIRLCSPTRLSRSRLGRLASSSLIVGIATIGLGAPVLARYGYARCVDDVGLDVARPEPTRQPEAVTAGLESDRDAFDPVS